MSFTRTLWSGETLYTCLTTGQIAPHKENISIIQEFDENGLRRPYFKSAYHEAGKVTVKLSFNNVRNLDDPAPPWYATGDGPFEIFGCSELNKGDNSVDDLATQYAHPNAGKVSIWTTKPYSFFQSWRYEGFWGGPVASVFENPPLTEHLAGAKFHISGWGHASSDKLVRMMRYATGEGADARDIYLKTSVLQCPDTDHEHSEEPFEFFLPD